MRNLLSENKNLSKGFISKSLYLPFVVVGIIVVVLILILFKGATDSPATAGVLSTNNTTLGEPSAQMTINKEMSFPLKDEDGEEVAKLKYEILSAELRDQIIVKGQKATAIDGRTFLIINLKITNDFEKPIELRVRDYIRLVKKGSNEKMAPEIHNDPTEVQALSTKYTRLGFPINKTDQDMILYVGEINGEKQQIKLQF